MEIIQLNESSKQNLLADLLKRDPNNYGEYMGKVQKIVDDVKERGDAALFGYTKEFDKADIHPDNIRVTEEEIAEAMGQVDPELIAVEPAAYMPMGITAENVAHRYNITREDMANDIKEAIKKNGGDPIKAGCVWLDDYDDEEVVSVGYGLSDGKLYAILSNGKYLNIDFLSDEEFESVWFESTQIRR